MKYSDKNFNLGLIFPENKLTKLANLLQFKRMFCPVWKIKGLPPLSTPLMSAKLLPG